MTGSSPPRAFLTSGASSVVMTTPTSQNQLTTRPPHHSRRSRLRSRNKAQVDRAMLKSITRSGAASPVRGMNSAEIQEANANAIIRPAKAAGLPFLDAKPAMIVPVRMAMKVAPSTSALPRGNSASARWSGRMPYLIGPNRAAMTPTKNRAANRSAGESYRKPAIAMAATAIAGFLYDSPALLFAALFLVGVIAALFGPIKYGILPDHLAEAELPRGNALVEGATFIAILTGTIMAGFASKNGSPAAFAGLMIAFALASWISALLIPRTGEAAPDLVIDFNIARSTWALLRDLNREYRLWWGGLVVSWFWLVGVVVTTLLAPLVKKALGGDEQGINAYLAGFSIAIAIGSGPAALLARGR